MATYFKDIEASSVIEGPISEDGIIYVGSNIVSIKGYCFGNKNESFIYYGKSIKKEDNYFQKIKFSDDSYFENNIFLEDGDGKYNITLFTIDTNDSDIESTITVVLDTKEPEITDVTITNAIAESDNFFFIDTDKETNIELSINATDFENSSLICRAYINGFENTSSWIYTNTGITNIKIPINNTKGAVEVIIELKDKVGHIKSSIMKVILNSETENLSIKNTVIKGIIGSVDIVQLTDTIQINTFIPSYINKKVEIVILEDNVEVESKTKKIISSFGNQIIDVNLDNWFLDYRNYSLAIKTTDKKNKIKYSEQIQFKVRQKNDNIYLSNAKEFYRNKVINFDLIVKDYFFNGNFINLNCEVRSLDGSNKTNNFIEVKEIEQIDDDTFRLNINTILEKGNKKYKLILNDYTPIEKEISFIEELSKIVIISNGIKSSNEDLYVTYQQGSSVNFECNFGDVDTESNITPPVDEVKIISTIENLDGVEVTEITTNVVNNYFNDLSLYIGVNNTYRITSYGIDLVTGKKTNIVQFYVFKYNQNTLTNFKIKLDDLDLIKISNESSFSLYFEDIYFWETANIGFSSNSFTTIVEETRNGPKKNVIVNFEKIQVNQSLIETVNLVHIVDNNGFDNIINSENKSIGIYSEDLFKNILDKITITAKSEKLTFGGELFDYYGYFGEINLLICNGTKLNESNYINNYVSYGEYSDFKNEKIFNTVDNGNGNVELYVYFVSKKDNIKYIYYNDTITIPIIDKYKELEIIPENQYLKPDSTNIVLKIPDEYFKNFSSFSFTITGEETELLYSINEFGYILIPTTQQKISDALKNKEVDITLKYLMNFIDYSTSFKVYRLFDEPPVRFNNMRLFSPIENSKIKYKIYHRKLAHIENGVIINDNEQYDTIKSFSAEFEKASEYNSIEEILKNLGLGLFEIKVTSASSLLSSLVYETFTENMTYNENDFFNKFVFENKINIDDISINVLLERNEDKIKFIINNNNSIVCSILNSNDYVIYSSINGKQFINIMDEVTLDYGENDIKLFLAFGSDIKQLYDSTLFNFTSPTINIINVTEGGKMAYFTQDGSDIEIHQIEEKTDVTFSIESETEKVQIDGEEKNTGEEITKSIETDTEILLSNGGGKDVKAKVKVKKMIITENNVASEVKCENIDTAILVEEKEIKSDISAVETPFKFSAEYRAKDDRYIKAYTYFLKKKNNKNWFGINTNQRKLLIDIAALQLNSYGYKKDEYVFEQVYFIIEQLAKEQKELSIIFIDMLDLANMYANPKFNEELIYMIKGGK